MGPGVRRDDESLIWDDGELANDHRGQTGAAAAASPEMAIVRQARNDPDDALRGVMLRLLAVRDVRHRHAYHRLSLAVAAGSHLHAVYLCDFHWRCGRDPPQRPSLSDRDFGGDARHAAAD